jgi:hypothetical protein
MKTISILLFAFFITISSFAQTGINYKAILKDDNGNILANQNMKVRFIIRKSNGSNIHSETHTTTSNANGIIMLNIGEGTPGQFQDFNTIDWGDDYYSLVVGIDPEMDGTYINFEETEFKKVPYALHALKAANVTGLEAINEGNGIGWRLIGKNPDHYGSIGNHAIDLSYTDPNIFIAPYPLGATGFASVALGFGTAASEDGSIALGNTSNASGGSATAIGGGIASGGNSLAVGTNSKAEGNNSTAISYATAIGRYSIAMGYESKAHEEYSIAIGYSAEALGEQSIAMGSNTTAYTFAETAIGSYNKIYNPTDTDVWRSYDRLFVIGNGTSSSNRSDAFIVLKNGNVGVGGNFTPMSSLEVAHQNGVPTSSNLTNALSIRNLGVNVNNPDDDKSWQFYTQLDGYLLLFNNGNFRGSWNATSGAYVQVSDRRLKKDITPLDNGTLNKVMQLNPVSYLMIDQTDAKRNLGLISQEVQEIFPSITHSVKEQDILTLSYTELISILIKALQEQQEIINNQDSKINTLTEELEQLKRLDSRVEQLEAILKTSNQ